MNELPSPDQPAALCYLLVVIFGAWVGASYINQLLDSSPERWGFFKTWVLLLAHIPVPLVLFWFLDHTNAIRDTSVFAAILVAVGYRQIFAGGVQGIIMPGQTPTLWKPFEAWVARTREHISNTTMTWRNRFNEKLRKYLSADAGRVARFRQLTFKHVKDPAKLEQELAALKNRTRPAELAPEAWEQIQRSDEANILLQELRSSLPDYAWHLKDQRLIAAWQYNFWLGNRRAHWIAWTVTPLLFLLISIGAIAFIRSERIQIAYHHWRFGKVNTSERDRFRTEQFLYGRLARLTNGSPEREGLLAPVLKHLRFKDVPARLARDAVRMALAVHDCDKNKVLVPQLIAAVRTDNPAVRLVVHDALKHVQALDYPACKISTNLLNWKPQQDSPLSEIDERAREWNQWWMTTSNCCVSAAKASG